MIFRYTVLYVADVAKALDFYRDALGFEDTFLHESGDYGEIRTGSTKLAFSSHRLMNSLGKNPAAPEPSRPVFEIAFETDEVESAFARAVAAGAREIQPVREEPWGQTTSYLSDPDGYLFEICSPVRSPAGETQ